MLACPDLFAIKRLFSHFVMGVAGIASSLILTGFFFFAIICMKLELPTWVLVVISICNDLSAMATSLDKVSAVSCDAADCLAF